MTNTRLSLVLLVLFVCFHQLLLLLLLNRLYDRVLWHYIPCLPAWHDWLMHGLLGTLYF